MRASLDVRHGSDEIRIRSVEGLLRKAEQIAMKRGLDLESQVLLEQPAVEMDSAPG